MMLEQEGRESCEPLCIRGEHTPDCERQAGREATCRVTVKSTGHGESRRWVATCSCGWATGPLLTSMQAHSAACDHDGSL